MGEMGEMAKWARKTDQAQIAELRSSQIDITKLLLYPFSNLPFLPLHWVL
jgi:hypothetical protein